MKKIIFALAASALAATSVPVMADPPAHAPAHGKRAKDRAIYDNYGRYIAPRQISKNSHVWRNKDGRYYCKRADGSTGVVVGDGVRELDRYDYYRGRDRSLGSILGDAALDVLERTVNRGGARCR